MKYPPFKRLPVRSDMDFLSYAGASVLSDRIKEAWKAVGYEITPVIERCNLGSSVAYVIRLPQLINGIPKNA